jgi:hypothetical protein
LGNGGQLLAIERTSTRNSAFNDEFRHVVSSS